MRLPHAAFKIGDSAIHTNSGLTGTIVGIRRNDETLQYLFECNAFKQWLSIGKLDRVLPTASVEASELNEDGEVEYKLFDLNLTIMREAELVVVTVHLTDNIAFEKRFPLSQLQMAQGFHGYLATVGSVTETLLYSTEMEKM